MTLRALDDADLEPLFEWEKNRAAVELASFTRADPSDRAAFDAHYARIRNDPSVLLRAIDDDDIFVGMVGSYAMDGNREVTYWIDPTRWGQAIASRALALFLSVESTRPLHGRCAEHNLGSAAVLAHGGFVQIGSETSFAAGLDRQVIEHIYRLDS